ncbi:methyltransferase domain-containing protein [Fulvivirgaceae bacterium BMA10]|uniref:Methyltransferase domain-containing protein n=1 Tax=Splendidivirga corallicola TaxID=3051826 RepID=A0ABT8KPK9_9BACT|nr:methyltransferase domain-containing protein [Fulvivirgaceae bacterium BMA10]
METLEKSVVTSMDGSDNELFPFLPYILQDLWEIGASPEIIINLVRKHTTNYSNLSALDLGCGKGAVSIKLAKEFDCNCLGIDAIKEFINEANNKAKEYGVDHLCQFKTEDIRESIKVLPTFDVIILGAIGPVLGDYYSTLTKLSKCLNQGGVIIIDDSYLDQEGECSNPLIQKKEIMLQQIRDSGMQLIDEVIIQEDEMKNSNDHIFENLKKRCYELIEKHPAKIKLFENYIKEQEDENEVLESEVVSSTMLIRRN